MADGLLQTQSAASAGPGQPKPGELVWTLRVDHVRWTAVSAVGFNTAKTKAMAYVRLRNSGMVHSMEIREGKWVRAQDPIECGWIA